VGPLRTLRHVAAPQGAVRAVQAVPPRAHARIHENSFRPQAGQPDPGGLMQYRTAHITQVLTAPPPKEPPNTGLSGLLPTAYAHPDGARGGQTPDVGGELDGGRPPRQPQVERGRRHHVQRHEQAEGVPVGAVGQPLPALDQPPAGRRSRRESQHVGVEVLLDDVHQRHGEARPRRLLRHADAVLPVGEFDGRGARPPRVGVVQPSLGDQRLDHRPVVLRHPHAQLGDGASFPQRLDADRDRARLGRRHERGAHGGRVRMLGGADAGGGPGHDRQHVSAVQLAADAPLRVQLGVELPVRLVPRPHRRGRAEVLHSALRSLALQPARRATTGGASRVPR